MTSTPQILEKNDMGKGEGCWWLIILILAIWAVSLTGVFLNITTHLVQIPFCLLLFLMLSAWGHLLVYPLSYKKGKLLEGVIWGTVSGIALGSLITSIIVCLFGWKLVTIFSIVCVVPLTVLFLLVKRNKVTGLPTVHRGSSIDILLLALLIVTFFFYFPFKNLGALVDGNYLYTWLFAHDFINRMVHVVSLSRGLPLDSFFFSGETLSYYWLAYIYPALLININFINLDTQQLLQLTVFLYSLLSTAALFLFFQRIAEKRREVLMLTLLTLCCYSYSYLYVVALKLWTALTGSSHLNIFGYDLPVFSGFSHTMYRFFLVQPQAILGMGIMLMIFSFYDKKQTLYGFGVIGLLTGLLFGVDATNGIMLGLWLGCITFFAILINKDRRIVVVKKHLLSLACAGLTYASFFAIGMYSLQTGKGVLQLKLNWFTILTSPFYFILEYGPMLILGVAGMVKLFKKKETLSSWVYPYIILLGIALVFNFFITNPTEVFFGLLKATRVIPICLLAFIAYLWSDGLKNSKIKAGTAFLLVIALPSFFMDNFIASDIAKPSTLVRQSDMEAARWIKRNLPKQAIIQAEPNYPGIDGQYKPKYSYSIVPIFAERRTAIGAWKVSSQEHSGSVRVGERFHTIKKMFATTDINECIKILDKYNINYIYVGALEKKLYKEGIKKFINSTNFELVYSKKGVFIFKHNRVGGESKKNG